MRKLYALCSVVLLLTLAGCGSNVKNVVRTMEDPGKYTEEEINAAMDIAIAEFDSFEGDITLLSISYNGAEIANEEAAWVETYGTEDIMVLTSSFLTGKDSGSFNPNEYYTGWGWIFVKENDVWVLKGSGYG